MIADHERAGDDAGAEGGVVPKLTIGQRILTSLPNLQRPSRTPLAARRTSADATDDDVVTPDEIIDATDDDSANDTSARGAVPTSRSGGGNGPARAAGTGRAAGASGASRTAGTRPNPYADWTRQQLQQGMKYLDDQERRLAFAVGPLVAVLDVVLTVLALHNHQPHFIHGKVNKLWVNPSETLSLGIASAVIAGVVVVCAYFRRRSLTLFALLFSGYGGGLLTMLPAWVLAGWLFIHFNRMQKSLRALDGGRPAGRVPGKPREAARAGASSARARAATRRDRGRKQPVTTGPGTSKRYTPPKPTRPRPPAPS